jgi:hypothetical protein
MTIRLVLFDALHTLVAPRAPIFLQYANVFEPHLGKLNPDAIKSSFKIGETDRLAVHHKNVTFVKIDVHAKSFEASPDRTSCLCQRCP